MGDKSDSNSTYVLENGSISEDSADSDNDSNKKALIPVAKSVKGISRKTAKSKTKKAEESKKSGKRSTPSHPKYLDMVLEALGDLKERSGSSRQAISKYITNKYSIEEDRARPYIRQALLQGVRSQVLVQVKGTGASGSFRLAGKKTENLDKASGGTASKKAASGGSEVRKAPTKIASKKPVVITYTPKKVAAGKSVSKRMTNKSALGSKLGSSAPKQTTADKSASASKGPEKGQAIRK